MRTSSAQAAPTAPRETIPSFGLGCQVRFSERTDPHHVIGERRGAPFEKVDEGERPRRLPVSSGSCQIGSDAGEQTYLGAEIQKLIDRGLFYLVIYDVRSGRKYAEERSAVVADYVGHYPEELNRLNFEPEKA